MKNYTPQDEFLARWLSGELSQEDLEDWKRHPDYQELRKIVDISTNWKVPQQITKEEAWQQLRAKAGLAADKKQLLPRTLGRRWLLAGIAASLALVAGIYFFLPDLMVVEKTGFAQSRSLQLPDGSTVQLNAGSQLSYHPDQWDNEREVRLTGEGYFEVAKGSTFSVKTPKATISVLGTSFNVKSRKEDFEVRCFTGKVKVSVTKQQSEEILRPSMGVRLTQSGDIDSFSFQINESQPDWTNGRYSFKQASLDQVIAELERQFDVKVNARAVRSTSFTGTFYTNDLEKAIQAICTPLNLAYTIENAKQITLTQKSD